jgi:hypothetical protein
MTFWDLLPPRLSQCCSARNVRRYRCGSIACGGDKRSLRSPRRPPQRFCQPTTFFLNQNASAGPPTPGGARRPPMGRRIGGPALRSPLNQTTKTCRRVSGVDVPTPPFPPYHCGNRVLGPRRASSAGANHVTPEFQSGRYFGTRWQNIDKRRARWIATRIDRDWNRSPS